MDGKMCVWQVYHADQMHYVYSQTFKNFAESII